MLLMLILYIPPSLFIGMSFVFKYLLNLISHVTSRRLKPIQKLLTSQHLMTLLVSLAIILLILMLILPSFQEKIRNRLLKPLNLPYYLNSYPFDFFEYLPRFTGEDHVIAEKHLGAFENFADNFENL